MNRLVLLMALVTWNALAQDGLSAPPPPPARPAPMELSDAPYAPRPARPPEDEGGRVRWGVSGNLGWHLPQSAFTLGAEGRIGYQVSNWLSAYAIVGFTGGFGIGVNTSVPGVDVRAADVKLTGLLYWYGGALAELMLGDLLFLAGGPVIASGLFTTGTVSASTDGVAEIRNITAVGFKPGLDLRLGLGFGKARPPSFRRGGFSLGLDARILFHSNAITTTIRADGPNQAWGAGVDTSGTVVTVVPMLMLGYDAR